MVFEQLFKASWIEKKPRYAFLLGITYSLFGIVSAGMIFGANPSYMAVAFTALLLIPSLNSLLLTEENKEIREKKISLPTLIKDHRDIFEVYIFLFLGIFLTFFIISAVLPQGLTLKLFSSELSSAGISGYAAEKSTIASILTNNIKVLLVCLVLSLIYGAGSILFITWNAAVWGAVFGFILRESAIAAGNNPFLAFLCLLLPVFPHMLTEAASYFSASIVGGIISKAALRERIFSRKFMHVMTDGLMMIILAFLFVVIAGILEVYVFPLISLC